MATEIRPVVSEKNEYHIDRYRYFELKYFCLQYSDWVNKERQIVAIESTDIESVKIQSHGRSVVERAVDKALPYQSKIELVERCCRSASEEYKDILLLGVTKGLTYDKLRAKFNIKISRDQYYKMYRRFFWILSISQTVQPLK